MANHAKDKTDAVIIASEHSESEWNLLKASYSVGDFQMPCCPGVAIPKTSPNGLPFFAHHVGECTTSPESKWHLDAKALVAHHLRELGIECQREKPSPVGDWTADVFFTHGGRQIIVELQHSSQTLQKYRTRQKRYEDAGIECYWLLYEPRYSTLYGSMGKWRRKHEFGGAIDPNHLYCCVSDLPVAAANEMDAGMVVHGPRLQTSIPEWLKSILEGRFRWDDGAWVVAAPEIRTIH